MRKLALLVHMTSSVGWIGAVVAYLALVVAGMGGQDARAVGTVWTALELTGWFAIVPLAIASLLTGLVMSLGTTWGLFRHYWVLFSFGLTLLATLGLLQHMPSVSALADAATRSAGVPGVGLGGELQHAGGALLVLLVIHVLNFYKPRGMTRYGWRKEHEQRTASAS